MNKIVKLMVLSMFALPAFSRAEEKFAIDPNIASICKCLEQGKDANCRPIKADDSGEGSSKASGH